MAPLSRRKALPELTTAASFLDKRREDSLRSQYAEDRPPAASITNEGALCEKCSTIEFDAMFKQKPKTNGGFWGPNVGKLSADSRCPLCIFLVVMSPSITPPLDAKSNAAYCKWQETRQESFLVALSPSHIFGIQNGKSSSYQSKRPSQDLLSVLTVLPGWIWDADDKKLCHQFWEQPHLDPGFILLEDSSSDPVGFSGQVVSSSEVNMSQILGWISYCELKHKKHCAPSKTATFTGLKIINCESRQIALSSDDRPYIALSYVWGAENASFTSTKSKHLPEICDKVVEDAIEVVKRLGYLYLWVDKYCIDQNDAADKHHQIANMDSIYAGAYLTIVCAAGDSASHGLPGVGTTMRTSQPRLLLGLHHLVSSCPNPRKTIASSKWMSRAWTYQEGLLSKRRLIFTEHQVYFQCSGMHCFESMNLPLDYLHTKPGMHARNSRFREGTTFARVFPLVSIARKPEDYLNRVNEYVQRDMSYDSDALNAILGVLKVFEKSESPVYHHWGVPLFSLSTSYSEKSEWISNYSIGLAWQFDTVAERRRGQPSWSWVGWKNWSGLNLPLVQFGPYTARLRDPRDFEGVSYHYVKINRVPLQVTVEVQGNYVSWLKDGHPNLHALSVSSPFLHIDGWTTELQLCRTTHSKCGWGISSEIASFVHISSVFTMEESDPGWHQWKALFIECNCSGYSGFPLYYISVYLLLKAVEGCYERVGVCTFSTPTTSSESSDKVFLGQLELRRESIKLG